MVENKELLNRLLTAFAIESEERIKHMKSLLLELEKTSAFEKQADIIETLYREVHSIKGASRTVDKNEIGIVCEAAEKTINRLKRGELTYSPELFDSLNKAVDVIENIILTPHEVLPGNISELIERLALL
ncbi:MAG: hypothetical protein HOC71_17595 [Candidatus Latescibacteria bacterium]|jgi:two-component system, chemotaxis family, sensor kinase CheA|nr:hypothetical protein [Candidatus Latescibacterota bacterium]